MLILGLGLGIISMILARISTVLSIAAAFFSNLELCILL